MVCGLKPETRNLLPEARSLTPETLYPLPGTKYQVPFDLQDWSKDDTFAVPKRVTRSHAPRTPGLGLFLSRKIQSKNRDVAQPGSALAWGARGREFESRHPDPVKSRPQRNLGPCCFWPVQTWFKHFDHF